MAGLKAVLTNGSEIRDIESFQEKGHGVELWADSDCIGYIPYDRLMSIEPDEFADE